MSWLKKSLSNLLRYWYIILLIIVLICLIIFVIIKSVSNSYKVLFANVLENYSVSIYDEDEYFKLRLYTNKENTMYFKSDNITKCYFKNKLKSGEVTDSFRVNLYSIEYNTLIKMSDIAYYVYDFSFQIPFKETNALKYENFYLEMDYINEEEVDLYLGSLCLLTENSFNNDLVISSLKGETEYINNKETLSKILLNIKYDESIDILGIELLSGVLDLTDYTVNSDNFNYEIIINKEVDVPLSRLGIIIRYKKNDKEYEEIIDPFTFFTNTLEPQLEKYYYE